MRTRSPVAQCSSFAHSDKGMSCDVFGGHYLRINGRPSLDHEHDAAAIVATVTYVLPGGRHGIAPEFCVMGLRVTEVPKQCRQTTNPCGHVDTPGGEL